MKNSAKHADGLKQLHRRLLRDGKPEPRQALEPLDAFVRGAMSYDITDSRAEDVMKAIGREFVDLNELRVSTDLEIQELLGDRYPAMEDRVALITQCLNDMFRARAHHEPGPVEDDQQAGCAAVPARTAGDGSLRRGVRDDVRL